MFRWFYGGKGGTCQVKNHAPGSKRAEFSNYTMKTLGSGDVIGEYLQFICLCFLFAYYFLFLFFSLAAVKLPAGEDYNEWLAANSK